MERELQHQYFFRWRPLGEDRNGAGACAFNGDYGDAGAAGGGTAVPGFAATAVAVGESAYAEGIEVEGIFFGGGGRAFTGGGAHRVRGGVLRGRPTFRSVGAAGNQLRRVGEHADSVDFGSGDRVAGFDERGVYVPAVCHSVFYAADRVTMDCGDRASVHVELSAQQLSAGAAVHSRNRNRFDRNRRRGGDAAVGNSGDADLALYGGCFAGGFAAGALEQFVFQGFRNCGGAGGSGALAVCCNLVSVAREI